MTFSDSRVVKLLQSEFIPVWESVAPVKTVTFDLGEGRSFKGTVSGEIAVYFCTPEGLVYDILPALQSPAATLAAMKQALEFYNTHQGKLTPELVRKFHLNRMREFAGNRFAAGAAFSFGDEEENGLPAKPPGYAKSAAGIAARENYINEAIDKATRDLRIMSGSKLRTVDGPGSTQSITIVEPGGRGYFLWEVDRRFINNVDTRVSIPGIPLQKEVRNTPPKTIPLKTPLEWQTQLFEEVLKQPLEGGEELYDSDSLETLRLIGD